MLDFSYRQLYNYCTVKKLKEVLMTGKIGRPKINNPRDKRLTIRVTQSEFEEIGQVAESKHLTKTDAVLKGIELLKSSE